MQFSLSANVLITLVIAMVLEQVCAEWFCGFINHHQALKKPHSYEEICSSNRKDLREFVLIFPTVPVVDADPN